MNHTKSVFLFGSALLTDSVSNIRLNDVSVLRSVSRQSLISSMSIPWPFDPKYLSDESIKPWQRRMLHDDFQSSLPTQVHELSLETDLILMDLVDERFGVYRDPSGKTMTDSVILRSLDCFPSLIDGFSKIQFGSDLHFELWTKSVDDFSKFLSSLGLKGKTLVLKNHWATSTIEGKLIDSGVIKGDPKRMNSLYERYFGYLKNEAKFNLIEIPRELCRADLNHKWGKSFVNYDNQVYDFVASRIKSTLGF